MSDKKVYSQKEVDFWIDHIKNSVPDHTETSKETLNLLSKEYVKRWVIVTAFSICFGLVFIVYNYTSKIHTELEVYKGDVWENMTTTNEKIAEMNASVEGIKTNVDWLIDLFNNSEINIE